MKLAWYDIKTDEQAKEYIGVAVYEPYTVQRVGKIIDCYLETKEYQKEIYAGHCISMRYDVWAKVKWLKQTQKYPDQITEVPLQHLQDYETLIEDHRRKYEKHQAILEEVRRL